MSTIPAQGVHHITFVGPNREATIYKFVPPEGCSVVDVLALAHRLRVAAGAYNIQDVHLADAIAELTRRKTMTLTEVALT
jgi:hypothetical protein